MPHNPFNAYDLLDIPPAATVSQIKTAFKLKAKEFHPDMHDNAPPATVLFKILVQAKEILLDPKSRLEHDYAQGIKQKPEVAEDIVYGNDSTDSTDWGSLILAGVAGIAIGASIFRKSRKRKK